MKKRALIYIGVLLLLLAAVTAFRLRPAEPENSVLYERYKDMPGVRVGFVKDFPVGDSISCDVTVFEALTDEGWEWMLDEFHLHEMFAEWKRMDSIAVATGGHKPDPAYSLNLWVSAPNHPEVWGSRLADPGADSNDVVIASRAFRWIAAFHTHNEQQQNGVIHGYMRRAIRSGLRMAPGKENDTINIQ
jgi:hypothetical protein